MEKIKISVIIPVYNMAEYIFNALESVERQTLQEKEIIVVDDGSTDFSYGVAVKYAEEHRQISVFKQENKGSGSARNLGIQKAKGEYVCFLDADDFYVEDDVLEYLYDLAKQNEVDVCGGSSCNYQNGSLSLMGMRKERRFTKNEYIKKENYPGITGYCAFIYKRSFLIRNSIFFPEYLRGQDAPFFVKAIACSGGAFCSSKLVYAYRKDHKTVEFTEKKAVDLVSSFRDVLYISIEYKMKYVYQIVVNELKGEIGALAYKFAYEGSAEMNQLINEYNFLAKKSTDENVDENQKLLLAGDEIAQYIHDNRKKKEEFIHRLKKTKKVYIFGAGTIGKKVVTFLKKSQVNIESFLVSNNKENDSEIEGIQVKGIDQVLGMETDYIVIIATFWYSQQEIIDMLKSKGIDNIYPIDLRRFFLWQETIEH